MKCAHADMMMLPTVLHAAAAAVVVDDDDVLVELVVEQALLSERDYREIAMRAPDETVPQVDYHCCQDESARDMCVHDVIAAVAVAAVVAAVVVVVLVFSFFLFPSIFSPCAELVPLGGVVCCFQSVSLLE